MGSGGSPPFTEVNEVRALKDMNPAPWGSGRPEPAQAKPKVGSGEKPVEDEGGGRNAVIPFGVSRSAEAKARIYHRGAGGRVASKDEEIDSVVALYGTDQFKTFGLGRVRSPSRYRHRFGESVSGFKFRLTSHGVTHVLNRHGSQRTKISPGRIAVTREDFRRLPELLHKRDDIDAVQPFYLAKQPSAEITTRSGSTNYHMLMQLDRAKRAITLVTMWKTPVKV